MFCCVFKTFLMHFCDANFIHFYNVKKGQFQGDFTGPIPGISKLRDESKSDLDADILDYLYDFGDLDRTTQKPVSASTKQIELQWLTKTNAKTHNKSAKFSLNYHKQIVFLTGIAVFCCIASCLLTFLNAWFTHQSRNIV